MITETKRGTGAWDSKKYKNWVKLCLARDKYACQWCGKIGRDLEVHHHKVGFADLLRKYNISSKEQADICPDLWKLDLGITLCKNCHNLTKNNNERTYKSRK